MRNEWAGVEQSRAPARTGTAPGSHVLAGQDNHASGGRDAGWDSYQAVASGPGGQVEVNGDFYPTH